MNFLDEKLGIKKNNPIYVTAHRGANAECPENTLLSFKTAIEIGADLVEMDIHKTKDDQIVVMHDHSTKRTSNMELIIADNTYEKLKEADLTEGQTIPLLSEVFEQFKGKTGFVIEIKSAGLTKNLLDLINEHDVGDSCVIISFKHDELVDFRKLNASIPIATLNPTGGKFLKNLITRKSIVNDVTNFGFEGTHPMYKLVNKNFVDYAHEKGVFVNPWTVDSPVSWTKMFNAGVDGITTNDPRGLIKQLQNK